MADCSTQKVVNLSNNSFANSASKMDMTCDYETIIENAKEYLLFRDFRNCHKACVSGISKAKHSPEEQSAELCIERLCLLCIQALAEMNRWQEVLPIVQNIYTSIELCPATVIQLCLLLHAKVKEFSQCHAIASIWLRCKDNCNKAEYSRVASLYVVKVMIPQGQVILVPQFLNSCTHLSENVKTRLAVKCERIYMESENENNQEENRTYNNDSDRLENEPSASRSADDVSSDNKDSGVSVISYAKYFGCMLVSKLSYPSLDVLWKLAAVALGLAVLLKVAADGELLNRLGEASSLWNSVLAFIRTIFSPYRPGR